MSSAGHDIQGTPPLWLNLRERRCTLEGDLVRTFGGAEEDKGHFVLGPLGLVLANGILYAPDAQPRYSPPRGRILMFAIDGAFLGYLPEPFGDHLSYFGTAITEHNGWIVAIRGTDVPSVVLKSPLDATFAYQWTAPGCSCPRQTDHAACLSSLVWRNSAGERMPRALWG